MKPFVARLRGKSANYLVLGFVTTGVTPMAVCVKDGGELTWIPLDALVVEWGTVDWPFSEGMWVRPKDEQVVA